MEWAKRNLLSIEPISSGSISTAVDNIQGMLNTAGLLETSDGQPTRIGSVVRSIMGQTTLQRNMATMQRTFNEFLNVLEESINNGLHHSNNLFGLLEGIDKQYRNLLQSAVRETSQQEEEEGEMLGSLWTRMVGPHASKVRKFEKNKDLLKSIRDRTNNNKKIMQDHSGKLMLMKSKLDHLRQRVSSQLVRSNNSDVLPVHAQIQGLDDTYLYLKMVREKQQQRTLEMLWESGNKRPVMGAYAEIPL
jgi:hypothetical protein